MSDTQPLSSVPSPLPSAGGDVDLTGRKVGDYQLLRRLGRGGMAEVYLAEQTSLKRQVAVKTLRRHLAGDTNYEKRFTHEAQAAAKLVHANIVQIYEVGKVDGIHFIAQEYVPGQNLRQLLARMGRPLDVKQALSVIRQVASALQKAGEHGIVHRDIKPENIMITQAGEVKVADFGLARMTTGTGDTLHLTQEGMTMGTPLYMSPEQAEGKTVDPRSDIYSFGATIYHMLAGRPPFTGETALAVAMQHVKAIAPPLDSLRTDLPPALSRMVATMLAKRPQDRFAGGEEILKALRAMRASPLEETVALPAGSGERVWNSGDFAISLNPSHFEATQRLETVLKTQALKAQRRLGWWIVPAVLCASALLGLLAGYWAGPRPLF